MTQKETLKAWYDAAVQESYVEKLAAIEETYGSDEDFVERFDDAVDFIKQAQSTGELPKELSQEGMLNMAVQLALNSRELEKEAEEADAPDADTELCKMAGELLSENGITAEDIEKLAEEELEALAAEVAQELYASLSDKEQSTDEA